MAEKAEIILSAKDTTGPAFSSAQKNFQTLQTSAVGIAGRLAGIGAAVTAAVAAFEHFNPKSVIDQADALNKLNQKTGISVETLSAYEFAAKLADVSNEDLAIGLKKLSLNIAAAARGEQEQAAAFNAIGISTKFLKDNVGQTDKVFEAVAEKFASYNDGAKKNAIGNALFSKSFEKLIPLLNSGKDGLEKTRAELEKFGGVISTELAAKSEQFNDNLTKLEQSSQRLKIALAGGLIDELVRISEKFVEAAKDGNLLLGVLAALSAANPAQNAGANFAKDLFGKPDEIEQTAEKARHLGQVVATLQAQVVADPGDLALSKRLVEMREKADAANAALANLRKGTPANTGEFTRTDHDRTPIPEKTDAPALPVSGAGDKAEALLKKQLEGRLKALQAGLEREQDLFQFADQRLAELFAHGDLSIDEFYAEKSKAQLEFLAKQQEGFTAEIAALRAHEAKTKDPTARQDDENKISEAIAKQAKVFREAGQSAETAGVQQSRAAEAFAQSLRDVDAQLADLGGDKFGADLLRNAQRLDDARKLLSGKTGGDPARLAALQNALDLQARANKEQASAQQLAESSANAEELFNIRAARAGLDRNETERGLLALHEQQLTALDAQIARYGELVQRSAELNKGIADPALLTFYENLKLARERAFDAKDPGLIRFNELATQAGDSIAQSFENAQLEGGKLRDVLRALGKDLFKLLYHDLVTKPLAGQITNAIKGLGASGTGGGSDKLLSGIGNSIAKLFGMGGPEAKPALTTGDFTRTDHDTTPVALPSMSTASAGTGDAAQLAATDQATTALQALADAANAASGALGKPPGTVAPATPGSALPGAATPATEASAEQVATDASTESTDTAAKSLDNLGTTAQSSAATFDSAISTMAASAIRGTTALGGLPGALGGLINYLTQLLSSSGSGGGGGLGSLFSSFFGGSSGGSAGGTEATDAALELFFHAGGIVGTTSDLRPVSRGVFALARRMHDGGAVGADGAGAEAAPAPVAGLAPNEVPAILMGGPKGTREEVLHADDPRHADNLHGVAFQRFLSRLVEAAPVAARAFHTGGLVGQGGAAIALPASIWQRAEHYHEGGVVGLLERGQMSAAVSGGHGMQREAAGMEAGAAQALHVYVTPPPGASRDSVTQSGVQIGQGIQRALRRRGG